MTYKTNEQNEIAKPVNHMIICFLVIYLIVILGIIVLLLLTTDCWTDILKLSNEKFLILLCVLVGMTAGILYSLRGIYVNNGLGRWNNQWFYWYLLRPITSGISGFASCLFLKAGLLTLGASITSDAIPFGYLALAFISGYNVDGFMKKVEMIAGQILDMEKSGTAKKSDDDLTRDSNYSKEDKNG